MGKKRHKPEEIVVKLQRSMLLSQGKAVAEAIRSIGVTEVTVLSLAPGVWWAEVGSGEAAEGP